METSGKLTKKEVVAAFRTRAILAAARRVLEERGLEAATMDEIAAAAGVAKGTIYLYFQGKEGLIRALVSHACEDMLMDLGTIVEGEAAPEEKLNQALALFLDHLENERLWLPLYIRNVQGDQAGLKGPVRLALDLEDRFMALLTRLFAEGMAAGQFLETDPRLLAFLLRGLIRAVAYYQWANQGKSVVQEALPVVRALLSAGLFKPGHSSGKVSSQ
ncbi:MAG: TetR/AcrR family transcriptional regulator [Syntrophales bacterium]|nr:TetR/AcrR family transcriptional regulator [Syntrophales bacterium]MDD5642038.1 TetR/AcrR family transcriptional regulator [Syntrophales bacterium]